MNQTPATATPTMVSADVSPKGTINTTTGEVIHRDVFTHTGNQLAAVTTTDPARVGEGYVWTTDPATGQTHGQIALTTSDTNDTPT